MIRLHPQPPAPHGTSPEAAIDLSANLNPLGPSPAALDAARRSALGRYPEADAGSLGKAAAWRHQLTADHIVPVPGASWGIWLCAVALLGPGDGAVALGPCFGEYRRAVGVTGAHYLEVTTERELSDALQHGPALCLIGNPANPTGLAWPAARVRELCAAHPRTRFLIDEAFAPFAPAGTSLLETSAPPKNAIVARSLTKELGLPGLRMGYLVAEPQLATALAGVLPAWPLSAPALAAAVAGMADHSHVAAGAALARDHIIQLSKALREADKLVLPSMVNFLLTYTPEATALLGQRGIAVRDCASFGLPGYVRIAAPRVEHLATVLSAIESLP